MTAARDRRAADIAAKQAAVAALLREVGRDGLLLLDPANFAWMTAGATGRGIRDPGEQPAVFVQNSAYRWVICSNVDTQRLFDEELGGLGFQLKEWPWQRGRAQLLADLCHGKRVACDVPFADTHCVAEPLQMLRRRLSPYEREELADLGRTLVHAVEATGRNFERGQTEEEIAGQLAHRLLHRGLEPTALLVSADGRMRKYRRHPPGSARADWACVVEATARRNGLHATCSRVVSFGEPDDRFRGDIEAACRWTAVLIAASSVGLRIADAIAHGVNYLEMAGYDHEWRLAPLGAVTGHAAKERDLIPGDAAPFEDGWAVVWHGNVGAVASADTTLVTPSGPQLMTPAEMWPLKRIRVGGLTIDRPDVLIREE